jgi:hypothetical protein
MPSALYWASRYLITQTGQITFQITPGQHIENATKIIVDHPNASRMIIQGGTADRQSAVVMLRNASARPARQAQQSHRPSGRQRRSTRAPPDVALGRPQKRSWRTADSCSLVVFR